MINGKPFIGGRDPVYGNGAQLIQDTLAVAGQLNLGAYFESVQFEIKGNIHLAQSYNIDSFNKIAIYSTDST